MGNRLWRVRPAFDRELVTLLGYVRAWDRDGKEWEAGE